MGLMDKVKGVLGRHEERGDTEPAPVVASAAAEAAGEDWLEVSIAQPADEAVTCQIRFDRAVSPPGTSLFETPQEASDWPAVGALLSIPGVHSVIGKGDVLVVARRDDTMWPAILGRVEAAIHKAFADRPSGHGAVLPQPEEGPRDAEADAELRQRIQVIIDQEINPAVADHGGFITLLDVQGSRVFIHMGGGCQGCAMSTATLKHGVETTLRSRIPEVSEILDTTDHAAGDNPYYQS
jgi:Fe-S cluster biogenesis protein NfuA